jgi:L-asparaginase/Glu-tRNA(Gln) amidotransferase subunit D
MNRSNKNKDALLKSASLVNVDVENLTPEQLDDLLQKVANELEANAEYDSMEQSASPTLPPWVHFT